MSRASLAEIAVELRLPKHGLGEVAFATLLETLVAANERNKLEELAARIGLSADATRHVLDDASHRATLLAEAHHLIKSLMPFDEALRRLTTGET